MATFQKSFVDSNCNRVDVSKVLGVCRAGKGNLYPRWLSNHTKLAVLITRLSHHNWSPPKDKLSMDVMDIIKQSIWQTMHY